jgi:hypothetical protein
LNHPIVNRLQVFCILLRFIHVGAVP